MHNSIRVDDYIFDTVALRDAFETIAVQDISYDAEYTEAACYALFDYFYDWTPARDDRITTPASAVLDELSKSERETRFNACCEALAENLREQYSIEASTDDVVRLARVFGEGDSDLGQYDALLQYVRQFAEDLWNLNPGKNPSIRTVQNLLNQTRNLPAEFRQAKENQYTSGSVNRIRARLLEEFHSDGEIDVEVLETAKREIINTTRRRTLLGNLHLNSSGGRSPPLEGRSVSTP